MRKNMEFVTWLVGRNPAKYIEQMTYKFSAPDKVAIAHPKLREILLQNFVEAFHQPDGGRAYGDLCDSERRSSIIAKRQSLLATQTMECLATLFTFRDMAFDSFRLGALQLA